MDVPDKAVGNGDGEANSILVEGLSLTFPNGFVGLKPTDLHIAGGQFCTLLGPSGSGKTTLLRAIAGLATPTAGRIQIGSRDVTSLPVQARNVGFVFQNYALFPHMNVAENIGYPLKLHNWSAAEREARVNEILNLIELPQAASSTVGQLSGGQQQRVAIGRALAYKPSLLLLDEPMGALDRRLRQQLGAELRELQQRTGITAVYVTHDQEEAFILSDKIAVMSQGEILQYSTPDALYTKPRSRFVGKFLGEANFIEVLSISAEGVAQTKYGAIPFTGADPTLEHASSLLIRPEDIRFTKLDAAANRSASIPVQVSRTLFLGSRRMVSVIMPDGDEFTVECGKAEVPAQGTEVAIVWDPSAAILLNK
jgi:putative spermidine/putrescine transport system ATP-binding protein